MLWTWNFARTLIVTWPNIWESFMKIALLLTDLWRHKSEKWRIFPHFCRNSSLICSTTLIMMKFYQKVHFVNTKVSKSLRHKWWSYDVIKITTWRQKLMTSYLRQKWRNLLKTLQNLLLCHNDAFCKVSSIFLHSFLFHESTLSLKTAKKWQIPMLSSASLHGKVHKAWF